MISFLPKAELRIEEGLILSLGMQAKLQTLTCAQCKRPVQSVEVIYLDEQHMVEVAASCHGETEARRFRSGLRAELPTQAFNTEQ